MASTGVAEDMQPRGAQSRQHTRVQSSGTPSNGSSLTNTPPLTGSAPSSTTPLAPPTALPRITSSGPAASAVSAASPSRPFAFSSLRSAAVPSVGGQSSTAGRATRATSPPMVGGGTTSRREVTGDSTFSTAAHTHTPSLATSLSVQPPATTSSLFGYLGGPRPAAEEVGGVQHAYGWRSVPATSSTAGNSVSHRSNTPSSSFQVRPAITSFMGSAATNSWNNHMNRAGGQQQQQPLHVGSPARATDGPANGTHVGAHSGWMLADPAGWSGWASAGRVCSGFEENQVVSFSWAIPEANLLRDEVEKSPLPSEGGRSISAGAGKSEVWTTQPIFGDGKWKLELVRTSRPDEGITGSSEKGTSQGDKEEEKATGGTTVLSVYLTSMVLDYSSPELEIPASVMIGIRPVHSPAKTARSGSWIWREFVHHVFRREHEYYECHQLPRLSDLLQDKDVQRQDAFTLTVQISTGPRGSASQDPGGRASGANEASPFAVQDKQLVHHSLINGLERLLDCKSTGDVVLIVRERGIVKTQAPSSTDGPKDTQDEVWTLPVGTPLYDWAVAEANGGSETQVVVRDRLLWAHASILGARSEFFHDMLQSHFAEGQEQNLSMGETHGDTMQLHGRRVKTLRIKDADFTTIYWLLRYLYLEEVEFISSEDVRCAALDDEWMTLGEDRAEEGAQRAVWEWKPLRHFEAHGDEHQAISQQEFFHHTSAGSHHTRSLPRAGQASTSQGTPATPQTPGAISPSRNRPVIPRELYGSYPRHPGSDWDSHTSRSYPPDTTQSAGDASVPPQSLLSDPHEHPCAKPPPASALALYRLAHRYHQQGLAHLSKVQLISSLTPQTAFPTLLATNLYEDLYEDVKAFVLDNWDSVSQTSEFERCCDEVSTGEWGVEAGRVLRVFMRSLLSPARAR